MNTRLLRIGAGLATVSLLAVACGDDDDTSAGADPAGQVEDDAGNDSNDENHGDGDHDMGEAASGDPSVTTPAADLRADMTALLQEHVYLAGIAINQAVQDEGDMEAPATASAVETLDGNSVALSEAVGSVYGEEGGEQFLALWRDHIGFFVDYTLGGATGDDAMQQQAMDDLDGYRTDFGAFIEGATEGELDSEAVADVLGTHVDTLIDAIDSVLEESPDAFPDLQVAASHMPETALALSDAFVSQNPDEFSG